MSDDQYTDLDSAMANASASLNRRDLQSRVVDAAMAARAAFHAHVCDNPLAPVPPELAIMIAHEAFRVTWDEGRL